MSAWEYMVVDANPAEDDQAKTMTDLLDDFGREGWELVSVVMRRDSLYICATPRLFLKRSK